jgi:hypothetical protein
MQPTEAEMAEIIRSKIQGFEWEGADDAAHAIAERLKEGVLWQRELELRRDIIEYTDAYLVGPEGIVVKINNWPYQGPDQQVRVIVEKVEENDAIKKVA